MATATKARAKAPAAAELDERIARLQAEQRALWEEAEREKAAARARLLADPAERARRCDALLERDARAAKLDEEVVALEREAQDPANLLARLARGTVEEQLDALRRQVADPPAGRLRRLQSARAALARQRDDPADRLRRELLECCPAVARLLADLDAAHKAAWAAHCEAHAAQRPGLWDRCRRLGGTMQMLKSAWGRWVELEEDQREMAMLRRECGL